MAKEVVDGLPDSSCIAGSRKTINFGLRGRWSAVVVVTRINFSRGKIGAGIALVK